MRLAALVLILTAFAIGAQAAVPEVGSTAPEFGGTKFYNSTAPGPVTLAGLRGKVVLIDFWATWCGPCVAAIPHVSELYEKYKDKGLVVIGHTDGSSQNLEQFIKDKPIHYIVSVGENIGDVYGVTGIPHVYIIDPDGKVAWHGHPASLDEKVVSDLLKNVRLSASPAPAFATPSKVAKVAKLEESIALGKVGAGVKALEKLVADKDPSAAEAAKTSLETISVWKTALDADITKMREKGDVFGAAELAASAATSYAGSDAAKSYQDLAAELKKDPGYTVGKEFQKLASNPAEARKDPRFAKAVQAFEKKHPDGYYGDQAKELVK